MGSTTNLRTSLIMAVFLMAMACTAASADQWVITVPDAGFDDHVLVEGDWVYIGESSYTGAWKSHVVGVEGAWVGYGVWDSSGYPEELPARSGKFLEHYAYANPQRVRVRI